MNTLTPKQRKFTNKYLETGNATEAAMRVYKPKKRATARAIGSENFTKSNI
jgi:phage terminase small subunit